jgi:apolipoprotein N-acyltransferase
MRLISARATLLVLLSAVLQVLCFPIAGQVPAWRTALCWIALIPFLLALLGKERDKKEVTPLAGAALGYLCGIAWCLGNCAWIYQTMYLYGGMEKPIAFAILVLFSLYLGLYHALFGFLVALLRRSSLGAGFAILLVPAAWVAVELARARITGFPWDLLGNSQVDNSVLTPLAPLGGVMAMSFVIACVNGGIASGLVSVARWRWAVAAAFVLLACGLQAGCLRSKRHDQVQGSQVAVMVQENIAVGATARGTRALTLREEMEEFTELSLHPHWVKASDATVSGPETNSTRGPTILIWPEAPSHLLSNDPYVREGIGLVARSLNAPAVVGTLGVNLDKSTPRGYSLYDSASLFDRTGEYRGRYDKIHLVPWGEYVPYKQFFAFASKLTEGAGDMDPGHERTIFQAGGHAYGIFICYESIFGDEVREFVKHGAEVLVNISDDGWYGDTGAPWQHLNMARMRAIENHRWVLRATNTGETTTIDPNGHYTSTVRHVRTAYALPFGFEQGTTFYTRHGDWFAYLCAAATAFALGFRLLRRADSNPQHAVLVPQPESCGVVRPAHPDAGPDRGGAGTA